jgi:hypothetical protein
MMTAARTLPAAASNPKPQTARQIARQRRQRIVLSHMITS